MLNALSVCTFSETLTTQPTATETHTSTEDTSVGSITFTLSAAAALDLPHNTGKHASIGPSQTG